MPSIHPDPSITPNGGGSTYDLNEHETESHKSMASAHSITGKRGKKSGAAASRQNRAPGHHPNSPYAASIFRRFLCLRWILILAFVLPILVLTIVLFAITWTSQVAATVSMVHLLSQESSGKVNEQVQKVTSTSPMLVKKLWKDFPLTSVYDTPSNTTGMQNWKQYLCEPLLNTMTSTDDIPINNIQLLMEVNEPYIQGAPGYGVALQTYVNSMALAYRTGGNQILAHLVPMSQACEVSDSNLQFTMPLPSLRGLTWYSYAYDQFTSNSDLSMMWQPFAHGNVDTTMLFLSFSAAVRNETTKQYLGAVNMQIEVTALTSYMSKRVRPSDNGVAYIVDTDGFLVATNSEDAPPSIVVDNAPKRIKAMESSSAMIRESASYINQMLGGFNTEEVIQQNIELEVDGFGSSVLNYTKVTDDYGLHWTIVVMIPVSDFDGPLKTMQLIIGLTAGALVVAAVLLGFSLSFCITFPLNRLTNEMKKVERMNLENIKHRKSFFWEIFQIQKSFFVMKERLILYKSFLPDNIFGDGMDGENEQDMDTVSVGTGASSSTKNTTSHADLESRASTEIHRRGFLEIGLVGRKATVLTVRITNHADLARSPSEFVSQYASLLELVRNIALRTKGKIDMFTEDKISVSFNALSANKHHSQSALQTAIYIRDSVQKLNFQFKNSGQASLQVNMGICTGHLRAGTLGIESMRANQIVGPVNSLSQGLSIIGGICNEEIMICNDLSHNMRSGSLMKPCGVYQVSGYPSHVLCWAYLGSSHVKDDKEWMYSYHDNETNMRFDELQNGVDAMFKGNFTAAQKHFQIYNKSNSSDPIGKRWLNWCSSILSKDSSIEEDVQELKADGAFFEGRNVYDFTKHYGADEDDAGEMSS